MGVKTIGSSAIGGSIKRANLSCIACGSSGVLFLIRGVMMRKVVGSGSTLTISESIATQNAILNRMKNPRESRQTIRKVFAGILAAARKVLVGPSIDAKLSLATPVAQRQGRVSSPVTP